MSPKSPSPMIEKISWGKIKTADGHTFKDAKCYPGGAREWDWNETGTDHVPGIQVTDIEEILNHECEVLVLSTGFYERLRVAKETIDYLKDIGIDYHVLQTEKAVKLYNQLASSQKVGGLFHSTC